MNYESFIDDFIEHIFEQSSSETNGIVNLTDLSVNCPTTTAANDLSISGAASNELVTNKDVKEILNDLSSDKIQKPKIWSIADILNNSSNKCTNSDILESASDECMNKTPPVPVEEIRAEEVPVEEIPAEETPVNIPNCVPTVSNVQNQIENDVTNFNDSYLTVQYVNSFILSQLTNGKTPFEPGTAYALPKIKMTRTKEYNWDVNGVECNFGVMNYGDILLFVCGTCRLRFGDKDSLFYHQLKAHVSVITGTESFHCPFCSIDCYDESTRREHQKQAHAIACYFCHIDFPNQLSLTQHIMNYHQPIY